jgi:hypothetical protein
MATIFNDKNVSFEQRQSPVPEFAWHTSRKLAETGGAKQLLFEIRSLDPGKSGWTTMKARKMLRRNGSELACGPGAVLKALPPVMVRRAFLLF